MHRSHDNSAINIHMMNLSNETKIFSSHKKTKFSIEDFLIKCDQIRRKLRIWSHLLKKSLVENFIFCAMHFLSWHHDSSFRQNTQEDNKIHYQVKQGHIEKPNRTSKMKPLTIFLSNLHLKRLNLF